MRGENLPLRGSKAELIIETSAYIKTEACVRPPVNFKDVPKSGWSREATKDGEKSLVSNYLKKQGSFGKNYRTRVRLCQCGRVYDTEGVFQKSNIC